MMTMSYDRLSRNNMIKFAIMKRAKACIRCPSRIGEFETWVGNCMSPTQDSVGIRVKCLVCGSVYVKPVQQIESYKSCKRRLHNWDKYMVNLGY